MTRLRAAALFLLGCAAATVVVVVIAVILSIRTTQQSNTTKADARDEALALVKDCVTPGGRCYQRGQDQTAKAVGDIAAAQAIAAAAAASCAVDHPHVGFDGILRCTTRRVAHLRSRG